MRVKAARSAGLLLFLSVAVVSGAACADGEEESSPTADILAGLPLRLEPEFELGGEAPDFILPVLSTTGSVDSVRLSDLRGSVVLLDFWGAWCSGCIREHPMLVDLANEYRPRGVVFYGVTADSPRQVARFVESWGSFSYELLDDDGTVAGQYQVVGWPTKVIVDREGRIMWWRPGGPLPRGLITTALEDVLARRRPDPGARAGFPVEVSPRQP